MRKTDSLRLPERRPHDRCWPPVPATALAIQAGARKDLMAVALYVLPTLGIGACANPPTEAHRGAEPTASHQPSSRAQTTPVAERDFSTSAIVLDDRSVPKKLWLMSSPLNGTVQALEFFSGEPVTDVRTEPSERGKSLTYTFTDRSGRRYASIRAMPSSVDTDQPSAYANWDDNDGTGHEVVLGATLSERKTATGPDGVAKAVTRAVDPRPFFGGQPACEDAAYVARTQASRSQDSEPGFVPRAKILADYDAAKRCWNTQPIHAVNLEDNTFLLATRTRVFRLSSKDLTPVGAAPHLRTVDIEE
jgi:hypothetical protein